MADLAPSTLWDGYACDGTTLSIPLATLGISATEALDWRRVLYALESHSATYYASLSSSNRPEAMTVSAPQVVRERSSDLEGTVQTTFITTFLVDYTLGDVVGEPT